MAKPKKTKPKTIRDELRCIGVKADGTRCRAARANGTEYCLWHGPGVARKQAKRASTKAARYKLQDAAQTRIGLYALADVPRLVSYLIDSLDVSRCESYEGSKRLEIQYLRLALDALKSIGESGKRIILEYDPADMPLPAGDRPEPPARVQSALDSQDKPNGGN